MPSDVPQRASRSSHVGARLAVTGILRAMKEVEKKGDRWSRARLNKLQKEEKDCTRWGKSVANIPSSTFPSRPNVAKDNVALWERQQRMAAARKFRETVRKESEREQNACREREHAKILLRKKKLLKSSVDHRNNKTETRTSKRRSKSHKIKRSKGGISSSIINGIDDVFKWPSHQTTKSITHQSPKLSHDTETHLNIDVNLNAKKVNQSSHPSAKYINDMNPMKELIKEEEEELIDFDPLNVSELQSGFSHKLSPDHIENNQHVVPSDSKSLVAQHAKSLRKLNKTKNMTEKKIKLRKKKHSSKSHSITNPVHEVVEQQVTMVPTLPIPQEKQDFELPAIDTNCTLEDHIKEFMSWENRLKQHGLVPESHCLKLPKCGPMLVNSKRVKKKSVKWSNEVDTMEVEKRLTKLERKVHQPSSVPKSKTQGPKFVHSDEEDRMKHEQVSDKEKIKHNNNNNRTIKVDLNSNEVISYTEERKTFHPSDSEQYSNPEVHPSIGSPHMYIPVAKELARKKNNSSNCSSEHESECSEGYSSSFDEEV